jgi:spore germination protein YaaH
MSAEGDRRHGPARGGARASRLTAAALVSALLSAGALASGALATNGAATTRASSQPCKGPAPRDLRLARVGSDHARLSWKAPPGAAGAISYRVQRAGHTVGQTTSASIVLRVTPGRVTTFSVQARSGVGGAGCRSKLRSRVAFRAPGRVGGLRIVRRATGRVTLAWKAATRGDAPVAGYRIVRDRAVVAQTHARGYALTLSPRRTHRVTVAAVDTRGHLGPASKTLVIAGAATGGSAPTGAPSTPTGVGAAEVSEQGATIWWAPSRPGGAPIAGYRVYRDNRIVGQTATLSMRVAHLAAGHSYAISVSAIDSAKHESAHSAPIALSTSHAPPNGSPLIAAEHVTDTSATLSWQPGSANSGTLTGYLLFRDGAPVGVIHGLSAMQTLASQREYTFTVRALDSLGYLSAPAPDVKVVTTHTPPSAPGAVTVGEVTSTSAHLSWGASTPVSGAIAGYRVFRDGEPVGQFSEAQTTLTNLAPSSDYTITVVAVDSLGAISQPAPAATVHTAEPTPTSGSAQAFLLATTDQSFADLQAHYQQIGVVYPTYFNCGPNGEANGADDPLVTKWAQARRIEVMPRLNCQNLYDEEQILNRPSVRATMVESIAALCRANGYQGIQVDFEDAAPTERASFTAFITALAEKLHSQGEKVSTIVTAKYYNVLTGRAAMYDDAALSVVSDYVFVTDWGKHWTTSTPGSLDEWSWFKAVAEYTATLPNLSKFVLGMPMYGIDWPNGGGSGNPGTPLEYSDVVALQTVFGALPEWDTTALSPHFSYHDGAGVRHDVWFTDEQSISVRMQLAAALGLKIGLWHLGSEDQSVWTLPQVAAG